MLKVSVREQRKAKTRVKTLRRMRIVSKIKMRRKN